MKSSEKIFDKMNDLDGVQCNVLFWHYPHYHPGGATPYSAIRRGDWKLIEFHEDDHVELYDLRADLGEKNNLAATMPERAGELRRQLDAWRKQTGAQMPARNPDYDPKRSESWK